MFDFSRLLSYALLFNCASSVQGFEQHSLANKYVHISHTVIKACSIMCDGCEVYRWLFLVFRLFKTMVSDKTTWKDVVVFGLNKIEFHHHNKSSVSVCALHKVLDM